MQFSHHLVLVEIAVLSEYYLKFCYMKLLFREIGLV